MTASGRRVEAFAPAGRHGLGDDREPLDVEDVLADRWASNVPDEVLRSRTGRR